MTRDRKFTDFCRGLDKENLFFNGQAYSSVPDAFVKSAIPKTNAILVLIFYFYIHKWANKQCIGSAVTFFQSI